jgi:hypothetical protein
MKVAIGGGPPTILASGQNWLDRIAVDATSVYWTTDNSNGDWQSPNHDRFIPYPGKGCRVGRAWSGSVDLQLATKDLPRGTSR